MKENIGSFLIQNLSTKQKNLNSIKDYNKLLVCIEVNKKMIDILNNNVNYV